MGVKKRNISILEYFDMLQIEYKIYQLRSKIYPFSGDKLRFREIADFKKSKVLDISKKNSLLSMFDCKDKEDEINSKFFSEDGIPIDLTKKDKYFYYYPGNSFSYLGKGCILKSYDFEKSLANILIGEAEQVVDLKKIKRIL